MKKIFIAIICSCLMSQSCLADPPDCLKSVPDVSGAYMMLQDPITAGMGRGYIESAKAIERENARCLGGSQGYYQEQQLQLQQEQIDIQRQQLKQQQEQQLNTNCMPNGVGGIVCNRF